VVTVVLITAVVLTVQLAVAVAVLLALEVLVLQTKAQLVVQQVMDSLAVLVKMVECITAVAVVAEQEQ
jgi:hypothetical protein